MIAASSNLYDRPTSISSRSNTHGRPQISTRTTIVTSLVYSLKSPLALTYSRGDRPSRQGCSRSKESSTSRLRQGMSLQMQRSQTVRTMLVLPKDCCTSCEGPLQILLRQIHIPGHYLETLCFRHEQSEGQDVQLEVGSGNMALKLGRKEVEDLAKSSNETSSTMKKVLFRFAVFIGCEEI